MPDKRRTPCRAADFRSPRSIRVHAKLVAKSYDRATELEMAGAVVLDLKPTEWRDLALAA